MASVFTPAVQLMHRLRYPQKFMLVGLLLLVPLLLMMSQYIRSVNHDINFAKKEQIGLEYNDPVINLLQAVQRHAALTAHPDLRAKMPAQQAEIDRLIDEVDGVDSRLGEDLEAQAEWATIKTDWATLKADFATNDDENNLQNHIALSSKLLSLIIRVGNESNLILDPDIDTYYLMDTVINKLPLTLDYMGQMQMYGLAAFANEEIAPEESTRLSIISGLAQSTLENNLVGLEYSFEENPALETDLQAEIAAHQTAYQTLDRSLREQLNPRAQNQNADDFYTESNAAIDESYALYDAVSPALDTLLQNRIDDFAMQRNIALTVTLIALALTIYLFIGFYLAVKETITSLDHASQRMVGGQMGGAVVLKSQDELAQVAVAFNNIASELITARDRALEASRAKSAFLANMSHELRTPMNAILGFAQLLERDKTLKPDQRENVAVISNSGEHLLALINNVLEMSKIEAGRITLNEQGIDIHPVMKSLQEMFQVRTSAKGLQMLVELPPDVPRYLKTDEGKLRQVLINLLGNAVKFTKEGGIALRVAYTKTTSKLTFEIEDTGEGIAPDEIEKVFDAFVQTTSGKKTQQEGTGLGLPLSQQFVRLMGGEITVKSQLGKGSIFRFDIHAPEVSAAEVAIQETTRRVIGLAEGQISPRILIVDDKWENRSILMKLLSSVGLDVKEAENGKQAVEIWDEWSPQLIWMDMRMPVMDGYEATRRIKATTKGQATVVIALTASAFEHERNIILSAGCDDFVAKPFREGDIFERMEKHLGVRFAYEDTQPAELPGTPEPGTNSQSLTQQSPEWIAQIHQAALQGDSEALYTLINQVSQQSKALSDMLQELVKNYRFDVILNLTEQAGVKAS